MNNVPPPGHTGKRWLPWLFCGLVLAVGITSTWVYWQQSQRQTRAALDTLFHSESERVRAVIVEQLHNYQVVMRGIQGFFHGSERVYYEEFATYIPSLNLTQALKGVQAVAFAMPVPADELASHVEQIGAELPVAYRVSPPGNRKELAPIAYIAPLDEPNIAALGFDIFSNPVARAAAEEARDSGKVVITEPLALVQDQQGSAPTSFVMYLPVYNNDPGLDTVAERRRALVGWVSVPFRMHDLMAHLSTALNPGIDIEIHDAGIAGEGGLLYRADAISHRQRAAAGELQTEFAVNVGARQWRLLLSSTPRFRANAALVGESPLIPLSGIALSVALALLVLLVAISRDKSRRRADRTAGLYYALSQVNQAIVRMDKDKDLFPLVCRMAVDYGDMAMAWIGQLEPQSGDILPVASHGQGKEALQRVTASSLADRKEGQGPTGTALRENRVVIVNDFMRETGAVHWHAAVKRQGWHAAAVFPLLRNGQPFAVLSVYHYRAGAFDNEATKLLREMSADISFALDNFDREKQRRAYEQALAESEARLSTILDNVGACIYLKDTDGCYTYVNQEVLDLWGVTRDEVIGHDDTQFFDARTIARLKANDERVLRRGQFVQAEETDTVKATGETCIYWSVKIPLRDAQGDIYALCGISTDVTEKKTHQERIHYLSNYDELTGLPNRSLLQERARIALASARAADHPVALLYIDLDRFKIVNDSLGHAAGDRVMKALSRRLTAFLHLDATLSRAGGDEFYLLLPGMERDAVLNIAGQALEVIARPVEIDGQQLSLSASLGTAFYPEHGGNLEELVQCADAALAQAKSKGRNRIEVFTDFMLARARKTLLVESELRDALQQDQLLLHYQPQIDMRDGRVTGIEALIRWQHPQQGLILPGRFIPVAEESNLIVDIGTWVLNAAAKQQALWQAQGATLVPAAVNLSVAQLYRDDFSGTLKAILRENGLSPEALELEITESVAMEHSAHTMATLGQLQALGVRLAIDDFGTGYSSLSYLKRYPVYKLKIDKSFVGGVAYSAEDQAIVTAIIGIAKGLGFITVAEGVETREQWEFLRDHGCDEYQGYYFSKPAPADEIGVLLQGQQAGSANTSRPARE